MLTQFVLICKKIDYANLSNCDPVGDIYWSKHQTKQKSISIVYLTNKYNKKTGPITHVIFTIKFAKCFESH